MLPNREISHSYLNHQVLLFIITISKITKSKIIAKLGGQIFLCELKENHINFILDLLLVAASQMKVKLITPLD